MMPLTGSSSSSSLSLALLIREGSDRYGPQETGSFCLPLLPDSPHTAGPPDSKVGNQINKPEREGERKREREGERKRERGGEKEREAPLKAYFLLTTPLHRCCVPPQTACLLWTQSSGVPASRGSDGGSCLQQEGGRSVSVSVSVPVPDRLQAHGEPKAASRNGDTLSGVLCVSLPADGIYPPICSACDSLSLICSQLSLEMIRAPGQPGTISGAHP